MKKTVNYGSQRQLTLTEAKKVLGTTTKGLSDDAIRRLVAQVDILTDVVIAQYKDSKVDSSIDILNKSLDTGV